MNAYTGHYWRQTRVEYIGGPADGTIEMLPGEANSVQVRHGHRYWHDPATLTMRHLGPDA